MEYPPLDDAIIYPWRGNNDPDLGSVAVMVASKDDLSILCDIMDLNEGHSNRLLMSQIYFGNDSAKRYAIVGPLIGAPYAVILLENLIAWGARKILFFGWCGAVRPEVKIGDVIVPTSAIIDEGTSKHYGAGCTHLPGLNNLGQSNQIDLAEGLELARNRLCVSRPSTFIVKTTKGALHKKGIDFQEGLVWTTDAIYRETREKVAFFQQKDVLAVEMETSALFTVGNFRNVDVGGILVVSDELSSFEWRPGFGEKHFIKSRRAVAEVIRRLCKNL